MKYTKLFAAIFTLVILLCGCNIFPQNSSSGSDFTDGFSAIGHFINSAGDDVAEVEPTEVDFTNDVSASYNYLSKKQKKIYSLMLTVAENMATGWVDMGEYYDGCDKDISVVYRALTNDYPQIFWLPKNYVISEQKTVSKHRIILAFSYNSNEISSDYLIPKDKMESMLKKLDNKATEIVSAAIKKGSEYEAELYIHDTICNITKYKETGDNFEYTAYGALIEGKAVCEGYSKAFQYLCRKAGIPSVLICGTSQGEKHMWNNVLIGGNWYNVDATWDDTDCLLHTYFNITDSQLLLDHTLGEIYRPASDTAPESGDTFNLTDYKCTATENNYFVKESLVLEGDMSKAAAGIIRQNILGIKSGQLICNDSNMISGFKNDYNNYSIKLQNQIDRIRPEFLRLTKISVYNNYIMFEWE